MSWRKSPSAIRIVVVGFSVVPASTLQVPSFTATTQSPPPAGVEQSKGSANPKGQYAALDALPDWGGIWFVAFTPPGGAAPPEPRLKGEYLARREAWVAEVRAKTKRPEGAAH